MSENSDAVYKEITDRFIRSIEAGIANPRGWKKPWLALSGQINIETKNRYRGLNHLRLLMALDDLKMDKPVWATYKKWQELGAQVQRGSRGIHLVKYVEPGRRSDEEASRDKPNAVKSEGTRLNKPRLIPVTFTVFNIGQVKVGKGEDFEWVPPLNTQHEKTANGESVIDGMKRDGLTVVNKQIDECAYYPSVDRAQWPPISAFTSVDGYYSAVFHEIVGHATGIPKRLDRDMSGKFGDASYAVEELIAELASSFICVATGILDVEGLHHPGGNADYLANWLTALRSDPKVIGVAAAAAEKACTYGLEKAGLQKVPEPPVPEVSQTKGPSRGEGLTLG